MGEDFGDGVVIRIDVDHPAEDHGTETAASSVADLLRGDGSLEAEFCPVGCAHLIARPRRVGAGRHAQICVQVPTRDAERNARIELIFGGDFRHGVHGADKLIAG